MVETKFIVGGVVALVVVVALAVGLAVGLQDDGDDEVVAANAQELQEFVDEFGESEIFAGADAIGALFRIEEEIIVVNDDGESLVRGEAFNFEPFLGILDLQAFAVCFENDGVVSGSFATVNADGSIADAADCPVIENSACACGANNVVISQLAGCPLAQDTINGFDEEALEEFCEIINAQLVVDTIADLEDEVAGFDVLTIDDDGDFAAEVAKIDTDAQIALAAENADFGVAEGVLLEFFSDILALTGVEFAAALDTTLSLAVCFDDEEGNTANGQFVTFDEFFVPTIEDCATNGVVASSCPCGSGVIVTVADMGCPQLDTDIADNADRIANDACLMVTGDNLIDFANDAPEVTLVSVADATALQAFVDGFGDSEVLGAGDLLVIQDNLFADVFDFDGNEIQVGNTRISIADFNGFLGGGNTFGFAACFEDDQNVASGSFIAVVDGVVQEAADCPEIQDSVCACGAGNVVLFQEAGCPVDPTTIEDLVDGQLAIVCAFVNAQLVVDEAPVADTFADNFVALTIAAEGDFAAEVAKIDGDASVALAAEGAAAVANLDFAADILVAAGIQVGGVALDPTLSLAVCFDDEEGDTASGQFVTFDANFVPTVADCGTNEQAESSCPCGSGVIVTVAGLGCPQTDAEIATNAELLAADAACLLVTGAELINFAEAAPEIDA